MEVSPSRMSIAEGRVLGFNSSRDGSMNMCQICAFYERKLLTK